MNIYIVCKVNLWSYKQNDDFMLRSSLSEAVKLTKNADFDKYKYFGYGIINMVSSAYIKYAEVFRYLIVAGLIKA